jgi:hypothetical protein
MGADVRGIRGSTASGTRLTIRDRTGSVGPSHHPGPGTPQLPHRSPPHVTAGNDGYEWQNHAFLAVALRRYGQMSW